MTEDEIIDMARQAGVDMSLGEHWSFFIEELEAFAKLVAKKEREKILFAIKELRGRSQEPVAWMNDMGTHIDLNVSGRGMPLYTNPPQRAWVGLTDEERQDIALEVPIDAVFITEAVLKDKNTRMQE